MFFMFSTPAAERVEVFNLGVPGLPGTLFKGERLRKVIGGKPDLAVLMFGTNDAVNSSILSSEAAFESVMTASIGEMCRSGIKVILVNLPPCEEALVFERHPKEKYQQLPPCSAAAEGRPARSRSFTSATPATDGMSCPTQRLSAISG